ncbi:MAG: DNA replication and repair protein RecF [Actinomycetota bacterium]|nr:DNA replication and repair protein RecF [Actinomycetota bacterium]MDQ3719680.1 DNA replication and repair protein RecF [Actinomycetota bacterium]
MRLAHLRLRDFRSYERAEVGLGEGLTVVTGPNGAGKTNLLEAAYFALTARSPRTSNERELVRRGASVARVEADVEGGDAPHRLEVAFTPGQPKQVRVDGAAVEGAGAEARPAVVVFLPDRLELVKGPPSLRRGHLDQLVGALWPARPSTRSAYSRALAQRNALVARIRAGMSGPGALDAWDAELARQGAELMADRRAAIDALAPRFEAMALELGLPEPASLAYRPRSHAADAEGLAAELAERRGADLDRGFTAHGPHRDDVSLAHGEVSLRSYGSQGQQRTALLALLFAERELLAERRGTPPLALLDDVMSELDEARRERLAERLRSGGQAVLTATEPGHVPGAGDLGVRRLEVAPGSVRTAVGAPA